MSDSERRQSSCGIKKHYPRYLSLYQTYLITRFLIKKTSDNHTDSLGG